MGTEGGSSPEAQTEHKGIPITSHFHGRGSDHDLVQRSDLDLVQRVGGVSVSSKGWIFSVTALPREPRRPADTLISALMNKQAGRGCILKASSANLAAVLFEGNATPP